MPQLNNAGLELIKSFEGFSLTAYPDPGTGGEPFTIGWGHTGGVQPGEVITVEQAQAFLESDLQTAEECVSGALTRDVNPNQYAALVSFAYNVGCGAFEGSRVLSCTNAGDWQGAIADFAHWVNGANGPLPGLIRRRAAEAALYATDLPKD
jgi:lysozyme